MAGLELRSPSGIRADFRSRVQPHCAESRRCVSDYPVALGEKRSTADLFLGPPLVSAESRIDLSYRIRVVLGAGRWPDRQRRRFASQSIPAGSSSASRTRRLHAFTNALLV